MIRSSGVQGDQGDCRWQWRRRNRRDRLDPQVFPALHLYQIHTLLNDRVHLSPMPLPIPIRALLLQGPPLELGDVEDVAVGPGAFGTPALPLQNF